MVIRVSLVIPSNEESLKVSYDIDASYVGMTILSCKVHVITRNEETFCNHVDVYWVGMTTLNSGGKTEAILSNDLCFINHLYFHPPPKPR